MKKKVLAIHKYLGLVTGIVVFIVSVTGCLWVFQDEITALTEEEIIITPEESPVITASEAKEAAVKIFPDKHVHGTLFGKAHEPIEVIFYEADPEFYRSVFLHPYSGEVLKVVDHEKGFFHFVLDGHMYLWLPESIGKQVVGISVLLFLVIIVSGLILWWPRKNNRKQRLRFMWKKTTGWKRKNYDLHAVVGFYILSLALILAFTGSVMAYDWFYFLTYKASGGEKAPQFIVPQNISETKTFQDSSGKPIDRIIPELWQENPSAVSLELHYPYNDSYSVYVEVTNRKGVYYSSDYRFFDLYTMEEIETPGIYGKYKDAGFADKVIRMNYDIHVGAIGGLPGKIIAFLASLLTATLPVTGFLLWYGRGKKNKREK